MSGKIYLRGDDDSLQATYEEPYEAEAQFSASITLAEEV